MSKPALADAIPTLTGATPTFTPSRAGLYEFSVVAIGDSGRSPAQSVSVQVVNPAAVVTARPGPAQTVQRGTNVTLDGSLSIGAASYKWEQIPNVEGQVIPADHVVTLSSATAVKPTFRFPLMALPTAPGPNGDVHGRGRDAAEVQAHRHRGRRHHHEHRGGRRAAGGRDAHGRQRPVPHPR